MAYTALTVEYSNITPTNPPGAVSLSPLTSSFIPGYPEYYNSTVFDAAFYTARETQCQKLIGPLNNLNPTP